MIGTIMISSNNSIDSAALPTGVVVPEIGSTIAVEENASAKPSASAAVKFIAPATPTNSASALPLIRTSSAPSPNTSLRICHRRLNDNSSPMANNSRTMPKSAKGVSAAGLVIVMCSSHAMRGTSAPSPNGPTSTPMTMKPMIGVIRNRANTGMTIPAAPRITSASDRNGVMVSSPATRLA